MGATYMEGGLRRTSAILDRKCVICFEGDPPEDLLHHVEDALIQMDRRYRRRRDNFGYQIIEFKVPESTKIKDWCRILEKKIATDVMIEIIPLYAHCDFTLMVQLKIS